MEIKKKKKITLTALFGRYIFIFAVCTILAALLSLAVMMFVIIVPSSIFLPANYAEQELIRNEDKIRAADTITEDLIPSGSLYGVYGQDGEFLYGNFDIDEQKVAWKKYKKDNMYAEGKGYYYFIEEDSGDICIVKYFIAMRYVNERLNEMLPSPETFNMYFTIGFFVLLTVVNGCVLSRRFARRMNRQLVCLSEATDKIASNDLEFETNPSDIREIDDVMASLEKMKEALKKSLKEQWDTEQMKNQQLSALAHDIKTPLTVVRGNAELLAEGELKGEDIECATEILQNSAYIEQYLDTMRQVLKGQSESGREEKTELSGLIEKMREQAGQLAAAQKVPITFDICKTAGEIICCRDEMLRACRNIVANALEHTDAEKGIHVDIRVMQKNNTGGKDNGNSNPGQKSTFYLVVSVRDYGVGFSDKALIYGADPLFSGDESRHDRTHQGLGLSIAAEFLKRQGGFLEFGNVAEEEGAEVKLWMLLKLHK